MELDPIVRQELLAKVSSSISRKTWRRRALKVMLWETTVRLSYRLKRLFDITMASTAAMLLLPVFIITAVAIWLENPGPVIYAQTRVGRHGRHFRFFKFRSMVVGADKMKAQLASMNESKAGVIFKIRQDPRITRVGKVIRKLSIDELPQLFNVLRGDMSLVGPRPPLPQEVAEYTLEERKRLHVIPGITCLWQVSGRSDIPFDEQVMLDLQYIRSSNLHTDLMLLLKTVPAVLSGKGAY